jgi:uncharacterized protein (DUF2236 family)
VYWRVARENLVALGAGPRAVLLEVAHPLVAAGVAAHSRFRHDPAGRLLRTMTSALQVTFGSARHLAAGNRHMAHCHRSVYGVLATSVGCYPAGTVYDARDPALRVWVWATMVDSLWVAHEALIRPLSFSELTLFYAGGRQHGLRLGLPERRLPRDWWAFRDFVDEISAEHLAVGPDARAIASALFAAPLMGGVSRALSFVSLGLLAPELRAAYGLTWGPVQHARHQSLLSLLRRLRRMTPDVLAVSPAATWRELQTRRR